MGNLIAPRFQHLPTRAMLFTRDDLQRKDYRWRTDAPDAEFIRLYPANALLDVNEGHEVLEFINRFLTSHGRGDTPLGLNDGRRIERLLQKMPSSVRTHARVMQWVKDNWHQGSDSQY